MLTELPIDRIILRPDARTIEASAVAGLVESIGTVGLINPIRVRAKDDQWEVIAGAHRLTACKELGLAEITAQVVTDDDLHAELAMIDENLCRAELSPADRARQTARRKAIYLELHPETANGSNQHTRVGQVVQPNFAEATAAVTGSDARTVRRDAERGEKVIDAAINIIQGTQLDTGTYLDKLKKLSPSEQVVAAKRDLTFIKQQERERAKGGLARRVVKIADEPLSDEEAAEKQYAALVSAWNKAGETARQRFRELIDEPVMDRRFA